jgi:hypothetical protein
MCPATERSSWNATRPGTWPTRPLLTWHEPSIQRGPAAGVVGPEGVVMILRRLSGFQDKGSLARRAGQRRPRRRQGRQAAAGPGLFFARIEEWGWDEAPPRVPMFPGDLPRQDHPCPRLSMTPPQRNCSGPPRPAAGCWSVSPSRCCCGPGCGSANTLACADAVVLDRHTMTRFINKVGAAAGRPHIHPHQLRHTLAASTSNQSRLNRRSTDPTQN